MKQGVCTNNQYTTTLKLEQSYFLFPAGVNSFYVSHFESINSHFGCYPAEWFQITEQGETKQKEIKQEEWPAEPAVPDHHFADLDRNTIYKARLIWRTPGYAAKPLKQYFIKPGTTHCFFWSNQDRPQFEGCLPLHWFTDFVPTNQTALSAPKETSEPTHAEETSESAMHHEAELEETVQKEEVLPQYASEPDENSSDLILTDSGQFSFF